MEQEVIPLLINGDEAAMEYVFRTYYPRLHYFSTQLIGDRDDAEDIVQEAFFNFWMNLKDKSLVPENLQAYLHRMVRNRSINYLEQKTLRAGKTEAI